MTITYEFSASDLAKRCHGCKWLKIKDGDYYGVCECKHNKVKFRHGSVTERACSWKNAHKASEQEDTDEG